MYIVTINSNDASKHTVLSDAEVQKTRFEADGYSSVSIVEKDTFNPPQD